MYEVGHTHCSSEGRLFRCWVCGSEVPELTKVALGDWRCTLCVPATGSRAHGGDMVDRALRHATPALVLGNALSNDALGLPEVPRIPVRS